jgi:hypothetical protein
VNRRQLEHLVRAAASVTGINDLLVIGSQAILGSYPDTELPLAAIVSVEADIAVDRELARVELAVDETALADAIDGALGEGSQFHRTFGYYAQGVEVVTATLTPGWRSRLVPFPCDTPQGQIMGWCLDGPDVWVAKAAAGRAKDHEYCRALAQAGLVERQECAARIEHLTGVERSRAATVLTRSW